MKRIAMFALCLKLALLAPAASATIGVAASHVDVAGVAAPVAKLPQAPAAAPVAPAARATVDVPMSVARAEVAQEDDALWASAQTDALHVWGKGLAPDRIVRLDLHAREDAAALSVAPAAKDPSGIMRHAQRAEAARENGERSADAATREDTPIPVALAADTLAPDDGPLRGFGGDGHARAAPAHVATTGTSAPPGAGPATPARVAALAITAGAAVAAIFSSFYARLRGASALANDKRARLHALLHASPGLTTADAARALDCDASTARHHLRTLAREGFAVDHAGRFFAAGDVPARERPALLAANDSARVLDAVRASPGASKQQIADALECARATVSWHLKRLQTAGLVRTERAGKRLRIYATS